MRALAAILVCLIWCTSCKKAEDSEAGIQPRSDRTSRLACPPYGIVSTDFATSSGERIVALKFEWIEENWDSLWPIVRRELESIADNYAYGEKALEPHIKNPKNKFSISTVGEDEGLEDGDWAVSLNIILPHGYQSFFVELRDEEVVHSQPIY